MPEHPNTSAAVSRQVSRPPAEQNITRAMNTCQWPRLPLAVQRAVANALGLPPDDEELNSVDQMLKDNSAQTPIAWIRGCTKNGDLGRLLNAAHAASWATQ